MKFLHHPHCNCSQLQKWLKKTKKTKKQDRITEIPHYLHQYCQENVVVINFSALQKRPQVQIWFRKIKSYSCLKLLSVQSRSHLGSTQHTPKIPLVTKYWQKMLKPQGFNKRREPHIQKDILCKGEAMINGPLHSCALKLQNDHRGEKISQGKYFFYFCLLF